MAAEARDSALAVRNLAGKAWRRVAAIPRRGVRLARRADRWWEQAQEAQDEWAIEREISRVARGRGPIIVGPWLSEVGFEVLYWVPFLRWFQDRYRVDRERMIVVSRGGVADWYRDVAAHYVEIFDYLTPEIFSRRNRERQQDEAGGQKQTRAGALDEELIAFARRAAGITDSAICHPSLMYRLFNRFWFGNRALDLVTSRTRYVPLTSVPAAHLGLPGAYIAAKFYTGAALRDSPDTRQALRALVQTAASRLPVVMLDTGLSTDEHEDYPFRDIPNVISLQSRMEPRSNLGLQTQVIAGARGYLGTCGGLAWIAPLLGVDTVAVYSDERFLVSHVFVASQMYRQVGAARFDPLDVGAARDLGLLAASTLAASRM